VLSLGVSSLGVPLVGLIFDRTGDFVWLFVVLGALAAVIVAAGVFLPRDGAAVEPAATPVPAE